MSGNKYIITQGVTTSMEKNRIRPIPTGKSMRMSYQRQKEVLEMPNLIEIQTNSYKWFLSEGLKEVFHDVSPITDYTGNLILEFIDYRLESKPKYDIDFNGWRVEGDFLGWDYDVYSGCSSIIHISKQLLHWGDTYVIDFTNPGDELLGMMLVIAIDAANCSQNK